MIITLETLKTDGIGGVYKWKEYDGRMVSQMFARIDVIGGTLKNVEWDFAYIGDVTIDNPDNAIKPYTIENKKSVDKKPHEWCRIKGTFALDRNPEDDGILIKAIAHVDELTEPIVLEIEYEGAGEFYVVTKDLDEEDDDDADNTDWEEMYEELLLEHAVLQVNYEKLDREYLELKKKYEGEKTIWGMINDWINQKKWWIFLCMAVVGFVGWIL